MLLIVILGCHEKAELQWEGGVNSGSFLAYSNIDLSCSALYSSAEMPEQLQIIRFIPPYLYHCIMSAMKLRYKN